MTRFLSSPKLRLTIFFGLVLAVTAAFLFVGGPSQADAEQAIDDAGVLAPLMFVVAYAILTVLLFPGIIPAVAAGAVFGVLAGTVLSLVGATIGAVGAFLLGRKLGRKDVERVAGERMRRIDEWIGRRGFMAVLYARLLPVAPFNVLNYVCGVTSVSTRDYVLATAIGMIPGTFLHVALGSTLGDPTSPEFLAAVAGLIVLGVGAPLIDRALRRRGAGAPAEEEASAS
ncbi:MAG: TVP38/TMEM64 family protein [Solirubrobacterales bacterium]|nr:TVP38/TMEM64 family protein [Solirubrobacterales bacterium]